MAAAHEVEQGAVVTVNWGHLPAGAGNKLSVEPTTLPKGRAVLGYAFDLAQDQGAGYNIGVEPTASLSSAGRCLLCHSSPQLNLGRVDLNEVLSAWCALCRDS